MTTSSKHNGRTSGAPKRSEGERSETERSEGAPVAPPRTSPAPVARKRPDAEVPEKPQRRRFTAEYKLRILKEADACRDSGEIGALLRREGLYSSHLSTWRRQREEGSLEALQARKRGRKATDPVVRRNQELEKENRKLKDRLEKANIIIEFQKKVADILGVPLKTPPEDANE